MTTNPTLNSRIRGALYGLATCDALGGPVEFKKRGRFPMVTTMLPNENFDLPPGCFTDDTSMTLCLAQSLIDKARTPTGPAVFDIQDQVRKYIAWSRLGYMSSVPSRGCFDIGLATSGTLKIWDDYFRQNPSRVDDSNSEEYIARATACQRLVDGIYARPGFRGNGSLMRVTPIALAFHASDPDSAATLAMASSKPTHPNPTCQEACAVYTRLQILALHSSSPSPSPSKGLLAQSLANTLITDPDLHARLAPYTTLQTWLSTPATSIKSTGYVLDTLEAALWSFFTTDSFRDGAIKVVNLGDDADTVGAVYGGLAGAWYGFDGVPGEWVEGLESREVLEKVVEEMCRIVGEGA